MRFSKHIHSPPLPPHQNRVHSPPWIDTHLYFCDRRVSPPKRLFMTRFVWLLAVYTWPSIEHCRPCGFTETTNRFIKWIVIVLIATSEKRKKRSHTLSSNFPICAWPVWPDLTLSFKKKNENEPTTNQTLSFVPLIVVVVPRKKTHSTRDRSFVSFSVEFTKILPISRF